MAPWRPMDTRPRAHASLPDPPVPGRLASFFTPSSSIVRLQSEHASHTCLCCCLFVASHYVLGDKWSARTSISLPLRPVRLCTFPSARIAASLCCWGDDNDVRAAIGRHLLVLRSHEQGRAGREPNSLEEEQGPAGRATKPLDVQSASLRLRTTPGERKKTRWRTPPNETITHVTPYTQKGRIPSPCPSQGSQRGRSPRV